jgi:excisionase family DNA binding protein
MDADNGTRPETSRDTTITVTDAAQRLQVTEDAVRKRLQRGTLQGVKTGGTWDVIETAELKDATPTGTAKTHDTVSGRPGNVPVATDSALVQHLQGEIVYLRGELAKRSMELATERERSDILQREALGRIEEALSASVSDHTDDQGVGQGGGDSGEQRGTWARVRRWWNVQSRSG